MKCVVIDNNIPHCPKCSNNNADVLKILDVDVAIIDDKPHFEFVTKCRKCDTESYYFLDMEMLERKAVDKKSDRYRKITKEKIQDIYNGGRIL